MKKCILLIVVVLSAASCKKNYTCNCNTVLTADFGSGYQSKSYPGSSTTYSEKMKESQAKAACAHEQTSIQSDFTNGVTDNGAYDLGAGGSIVTTCSLK